MEKLSKEQLQHFKEKLTEKKEKIKDQLQGFAKKNEKIENDYETKFEEIGRSPEDNASEVANYSDNLAIEHELEDDLKKIEEALTRIENNTYGICTDCNQMMSIERLEAMPEATLCIKCEK